MIEKCKICNSNSSYFATAQVLNKYDVKYYCCSNCGFVQTETPYWLDEAYAEAIAVSDVGLVYRNNMMSNVAAKLLFNYFDHNAKFIDYGGGYGLFVRLMRDQGFDFYWQDKFCKNIFARGFELVLEDKPDLLLVTAFELFEHLIDPINEIDEIIKLAPNILLSTELLPDDKPKPNQWWYYATHEGQHISIYTKKSLEIIASKYNLKLYTTGRSLHLLSNNKNLPENLFELIQAGAILPPKKQSLISRDFNQITNKLISQPTSYQASLSLPIILIDGVFFQLYSTGIARVWRNLLEQWSKTEFSKNIIFLDRSNTAPKIAGIRYCDVPSFSHDNLDNLKTDQEMLQQVCDELKADLFISSYYTRPITTPSVFMAYDMIPEVLQWDFNNVPIWRHKHESIHQASAFIAISENTADDLAEFFPSISRDSIKIAHCGVENIFSPAKVEEISTFKFKYGINKPYFVLVGAGYGENNYKNTDLFLQAYSHLISRKGFDIIITGRGGKLPSEYNSYIEGSTVHLLQLSDEELIIAYSGAIVLVYPSKYEGFGMPILEAMACGCPVITCPNSSLKEVAGDAAIYVDDSDALGMANALCEVQKPSIRQSLITAGLIQAKRFSWTKMANIISSTLIDTSLLHLNLNENNFIVFPDWSRTQELLLLEIEKTVKLVGIHPDSQKATLLIVTNEINCSYADMILGDVTFHILMREDVEIGEGFNVSIVSDLSEIQWQNLLPRIQARIIMEKENQEILSNSNIINIPAYDPVAFANKRFR